MWLNIGYIFIMFTSDLSGKSNNLTLTACLKVKNILLRNYSVINCTLVSLANNLLKVTIAYFFILARMPINFSLPPAGGRQSTWTTGTP
jgi:hypothetical protein